MTTTWLLLLYFFYDYLVFWMIGVFCFCGSLAMIQLLFNNIFIHLACTEKHKCPTCSSCRWPILDCIPKCLFRDGPPITCKFSRQQKHQFCRNFSIEKSLLTPGRHNLPTAAAVAVSKLKKKISKSPEIFSDFYTSCCKNDQSFLRVSENTGGSVIRYRKRVPIRYREGVLIRYRVLRITGKLI